jgi:hypothetical protein
LALHDAQDGADQHDLLSSPHHAKFTPKAGRSQPGRG